MAQKFHLSFIANIISLHYFLELGCCCFFYNINQGCRQCIYYQMRLTYGVTVGKLVNTKRKKEVTCNYIARQNLGAKETSFERAYFVCISTWRNHIIVSAFLRRFSPPSTLLATIRLVIIKVFKNQAVKLLETA